MSRRCSRIANIRRTRNATPFPMGRRNGNQDGGTRATQRAGGCNGRSLDAPLVEDGDDVVTVDGEAGNGSAVEVACNFSAPLVII